MSTFGWCETGHHSQCPREYQVFIVDPKTNKPVLMDEFRYCECSKRSCACYVPAKDRAKTGRKPRRKK